MFVYDIAEESLVGSMRIEESCGDVDFVYASGSNAGAYHSSTHCLNRPVTTKLELALKRAVPGSSMLHD